MTDWPVHGRISGPIVMIGFGSIGRGTLPLIERHFEFDKNRLTVIDPSDKDRGLLDERGIRFERVALTRDNYREVLIPLLTQGGGQGFCVNLSVDTSSRDIMALSRELGCLYIDTVPEPVGRLLLRPEPKARRPPPTTPCASRSSPCAAEIPAARRRSPAAAPIPGMESWFVQASAAQRRRRPRPPVRGARTREDWARLMRDAGVKGIHIAERGTQRANIPRAHGRVRQQPGRWEVLSFAEGRQPAELGWGTHETWMPDENARHPTGTPPPPRSTFSSHGPQHPGAGHLVPDARAAIRLPRHPQRVDLDRRLLHAPRERPHRYRPTCHYAYHPCNEAVLSLHEMFGQAGKVQDEHHILDENEIVDGIDELGVLLYGHAKNAYWYGSQLSIEERAASPPTRTPRASR
jgi:homospermidine synthase